MIRVRKSRQQGTYVAFTMISAYILATACFYTLARFSGGIIICLL